jgi:hypothetical protein
LRPRDNNLQEGCLDPDDKKTKLMNILGYSCRFQHKASNFASVDEYSSLFWATSSSCLFPQLIQQPATLQAKISTKISPNHDSIPCNFFKMCNIHCTDDTLTMPSVLQRTTGIKCLKSQRRAEFIWWISQHSHGQRLQVQQLCWRQMLLWQDKMPKRD